MRHEKWEGSWVQRGQDEINRCFHVGAGRELLATTQSPLRLSARPFGVADFVRHHVGGVVQWHRPASRAVCGARAIGGCSAVRTKN